MAQFAPQYNPHKVTAQVRLVNEWIFWLVFALGFAPVFFHDLCETYAVKTLLDIINIISILLFFSLEIIVEFVLFPQSEQKRRDDFLDNSFGSKFSSANSIDYYNNDNVTQGIYKAACNLFENVFFTFSVIKALTFSKIILPSLVLVSVFALAYFGFKKVPFTLTVLQVLFSANVLGNLIKHLILLGKLTAIFENWTTLFQMPEFKTQPQKYQALVYRNWLNYETILTRIQPGIPDKKFKKLNPKLTAEWDQLKNRYSL
jgi:hypothetical protein